MKTTIFTLCTVFVFVCTIDAKRIEVPNQHSTIQSGINVATHGDTILVAEGLYYENINYMGKAITVASHFLMDGDTSHISKTIIDGSKPNHPDTASVVLLISGEDSTSILNGFTITGGAGSRFILPAITFRVGGGVCLLESGGKIIHNYITGNNIEANGIQVHGGGISSNIMEKNNFKTLIIRDNQVHDNQISSNSYCIGAGITFSNNDGMTLCEGNKMYNNRAIATGNFVAGGGGVCLYSEVPWKPIMTLRNNHIYKNEISGVYAVGAGVYFFLLPLTEPLQDEKSHIEIYNNLITENKSQHYGGGMALWSDASQPATAKNPIPVIFNNTLFKNEAKYGTGIINHNTKPLVFNNIFWNKGVWPSSKEFYNGNYGGPNSGIFIAFNNTIQGGYPGTGNLDQDPQLNTDFSLMNGSPCIGAGTDSVELEGIWYKAPRYDFNDSIRPNAFDKRVDMGAIESPFAKWDRPTLIHVPGEEQTIQAAINSASTGDTVLVAQGLYYENINFIGKAITVASHFIMDGDTSHISKTIIDGSKPNHPDTASVVLLISGEDSTSILNGLTITGGAGSKIIEPQITFIGGGGIFLSESGGKIIHNNITANIIKATGVQVYGGGISSHIMDENSYKTLIIRANKVYDNLITSNSYCIGAGITFSNNDGMTLCEGNKIYNNRAIGKGSYVAAGGGVCLFTEVPWKPIMTLRNNHIYKNEISGVYAVGAGVYFFLLPLTETLQDEKSHIEIYNNLITENKSQHYGGGMALWSDASQPATAKNPIPVIFNNTLFKNEAKYGTGIINHNTKPLVFNNIFWNKGVWPSSKEFYNGNYGGPNSGIFVAYNNAIKGGYEGEGNINLDPKIDSIRFKLSYYSPCIGKGTESVLVDGVLYKAPPYDYNGEIRAKPINSMPDMGAIESPLRWPVKVASILVNNKTLHVYPNPTAGSITVHFTTDKKEAVKLGIYNVLGQQEKSLLNEVRTPGTYEVQVDISALRSGVYFMVLESDTKIATKLIKQ